MGRTRETIRRWDDALAQLEGLIATLLFLAMIVVAVGQALCFNLAERGVTWASRMLEASAWADPFLQKGTLWLAFLGASLATHDDKHLAIDLITKVVPARVAPAILRAAALGAGVVSLALAPVFFHASLASDATIPFEFERLTANGRFHVCDIAETPGGGGGRPLLLCSVRGALGSLGAPISSLAGAAQLIVPVMFVVIGLRLLARAAGVLDAGRERAAAREPHESDPVKASS
jgi:TRAP-type C4-dicarboxylate transport system permease small subunit